MAVHAFDAVNALINPALVGDILIAADGTKFEVKQNGAFDYYLKNLATNVELPTIGRGQVELCRYVFENLA